MLVNSFNSYSPNSTHHPFFFRAQEKDPTCYNKGVKGSESKVRLVYQPLHNNIKYDSFTLCISICDSDVTNSIVSNVCAYMVGLRHRFRMGFAPIWCMNSCYKDTSTLATIVVNVLCEGDTGNEATLLKI